MAPSLRFCGDNESKHDVGKIRVPAAELIVCVCVCVCSVVGVCGVRWARWVSSSSPPAPSPPPLAPSSAPERERETKTEESVSVTACGSEIRLARGAAEVTRRKETAKVDFCSNCAPFSSLTSGRHQAEPGCAPPFIEISPHSTR